MSAQGLVESVFGVGAIESALADSIIVHEALVKKAEEVREMWIEYWESFHSSYDFHEKQYFHLHLPPQRKPDQ